jgi:hypothetical protein
MRSAPAILRTLSSTDIPHSRVLLLPTRTTCNGVDSNPSSSIDERRARPQTAGFIVADGAGEERKQQRRSSNIADWREEPQFTAPVHPFIEDFHAPANPEQIVVLG